MPSDTLNKSGACCRWRKNLGGLIIAILPAKGQSLLFQLHSLRIGEQKLKQTVQAIETRPGANSRQGDLNKAENVSLLSRMQRALWSHWISPLTT